jgi:hypothetical protein
MKEPVAAHPLEREDQSILAAFSDAVERAVLPMNITRLMDQIIRVGEALKNRVIVLNHQLREEKQARAEAYKIAEEWKEHAKLQEAAANEMRAKLMELEKK